MRLIVSIMVALFMFPVSAWAQSSPPPSAPPVRATGLEGTLAWWRGDVEVTDSNAASSDAHRARAGEVLTRGARVRVGDTGAAEITLANGAVVEVGEHTQMMMFASPTPPAIGQPQSITTTLQRGTIRVRMPATPGAHAALIPIATGSATVFVGRADAMIAADLGGHITRIAVQRGRMRVRSMDREYILRAGNGAFEEFGRPPQAIRLLPPQPVWVSSPPERVVSNGEPIDVTGSYGFRATGTAAQWRVQLSRDASFHDLVTNDRVAGGVTRWRSAGLLPGSYYARVIALDADRYESVPSATAHVYVAAPHVVTGSTASAGEPARLASVHVPEGFLCGLDGAPPREVDRPIPLAPGRAHSLFCLPDAHGFDLRGITVTAEQAGPLVREIRVRGMSYGESVLALRLRDATGRGVPYAEVSVTNDQGVTVEPVREGEDRGTYSASMHWPRNVQRAHFRFTVNGAQTFEEDLSQEL